MLYTMLFAGGKGAAQNPNMGFGGSGEHSLLSSLDPIGNWITGIGGDPLNLYGNKNNPGALLFPGQDSTQTGMGPVTNPMTGGNPGLMSAYATFLRNLGAPPMQQPRQPMPAPVGGPMRGGGGMDFGGMGAGRPMVPGGAGAGYPGMAALSQLNFGQPNYPQPNTVRY